MLGFIGFYMASVGFAGAAYIIGKSYINKLNAPKATKNVIPFRRRKE